MYIPLVLIMCIKYNTYLVGSSECLQWEGAVGGGSDYTMTSSGGTSAGGGG